MDGQAEVDLVRVFTCDGRDGNPCPVVCAADGMTDAEMQAVARGYGHESGFVLPPPGADFDYAFRFWVPNHEMEMCGHATIGALWLLASKGLCAAHRVRVGTLSGAVGGFIETGPGGAPDVAVTQPAGTVRPLGGEAESAVLSALRLRRADLLDLPVQNAATSRVKTLVPLRDPDRLNALDPDFSVLEGVCAGIGSTGLYPYAPHPDGAAAQTFEARQFPCASGYPEDAATGIAATALAFGLLENRLVEAAPAPIRVFQGRAMGRLSRITVRLGFAAGRAIGCRVGGAVTPG